MFPCLCQIPVRSGLPLVCLLIHFLHKAPLLFPDVGLNVNLNTRGAKSLTAYFHVQAQRASVCHLAPALFSSKEVKPWHWDPGLREQKTRDVSCTVFSEDDFCSRCLVKALPLTTPLSKHTTVSFDSHAALLLLVLCQ